MKKLPAMLKLMPYLFYGFAVVLSVYQILVLRDQHAAMVGMAEPEGPASGFAVNMSDMAENVMTGLVIQELWNMLGLIGAGVIIHVLIHIHDRLAEASEAAE